MHYIHGDARDLVYSLDAPFWFLYRHLTPFRAAFGDASKVTDSFVTYLYSFFKDIMKGDLLTVDASFFTTMTKNFSDSVEVFNSRTEITQKVPRYMLKTNPTLYNFTIFDENN